MGFPLRPALDLSPWLRQRTMNTENTGFCNKGEIWELSQWHVVSLCDESARLVYCTFHWEWSRVPGTRGWWSTKTENICTLLQTCPNQGGHTTLMGCESIHGLKISSWSPRFWRLNFRGCASLFLNLCSCPGRHSGRKPLTKSCFLSKQILEL